MREQNEHREGHPTEALRVHHGAEERTLRTRDWVFAVEDSDALDIHGIALLMTARELAMEEDRKVWLTGLPPEFWTLMNAMGLEGYFIPFPDEAFTLA